MWGRREGERHRLDPSLGRNLVIVDRLTPAVALVSMPRVKRNVLDVGIPSRVVVCEDIFP